MKALGHVAGLEVDDYRWLVEEYRVSVSAPELKAAVPVSPQRLKDLWSLVVAP